MAYNESLANRVHEALIDIPNVEEKKMFRGLTFMVNDKMCVAVSGEELMCRYDPSLQESIAEKDGVRPMVHSGKPLAGYIYVSPETIQKKKDFDFWIQLCLDYNPRAKSSKKKK
jgi:hypothetical protein